MSRNLIPLLATALLVASATASAQTPVPRIVNGTPTGEYPTVAALLFYADPQRTELDGLCTGTLVGCHTVLTAAHCVCQNIAEDAADCARFGLVDAATMQVYLPHAGFFGVESMVIHPAYVFAEVGDIAVVELAQAPRGIAPSTINTFERPGVGTHGVLVGFGRTDGRSFAIDDAGLKRAGPVTTTSCDQNVPGTTHICWRFSGVGSSTCSGDSGGPLFIPGTNGLVVAGTTSGGTRDSCLAPDFSFDTDVFVHRAFIIDQAGDDLAGVECTDGAVVGSNGVTVAHWSGEIGTTSLEARLDFEVPAGAAELRVALNGQLFGRGGMFFDHNQFNLYVRAGAPPSPTEFDCAHTGGGVFGFCAITDPAAGTWHVLVGDVQGAGEWQVTATVFDGPTTSPCIGDCDGDGQVTVDELVAGVSTALGTGSADACDSLDVDGDGRVTVDEIVMAIDSALGGCN